MRLLGIPAELKLEIEQNGGTLTEAAAMQIIQASTKQAREEAAHDVRELQEVIGPHGAVTRVQAGGVRIARGQGIGVFADGIQKTTIDTQGNIFAGSDITLPSETTLSVFVVDQSYQGEQFGAGDLLIGDNTTGHVFYDASEGPLQFRDGTTVRAYVDTDGTIKAAGGDVEIGDNGIVFSNEADWLIFEDSAGNRNTIYITSQADNALSLINVTDDGAIKFTVKLTDDTTPVLKFTEDSANDNVAHLDLGVGSAGSKFSIGGDVVIWSGKDGEETVFNFDGNDIDLVYYDDAGSGLIRFDAGEKRLEIGADHYIPTRNSSNKTVIFNEANEDIDFKVEGDTDGNLFWVDAALDAIGIGGAAESGEKLKVHGDTSLDGGVTFNNSEEAAAHFIMFGPTGTTVIDARTSGVVGIGGAAGAATLTVHGDLQVESITNDTGLAHGTYTPTLSGGVNLDANSVPGTWNYARVGNTVSLSGPVTLNPTAAGNTSINFSLPVALSGNFTTAFEGGGNATQQNTNTVGSVASVVGAQTLSMTFVAVDLNSRTWRIEASYEVI